MMYKQNRTAASTTKCGQEESGVYYTNGTTAAKWLTEVPTSGGKIAYPFMTRILFLSNF